MGFADVNDLTAEGRRIADVIYDGGSLTPRDWTRALISTEICFASHDEWTVIQGGTDAYWISVLRSLQAKVPASWRHLPT